GSRIDQLAWTSRGDRRRLAIRTANARGKYFVQYVEEQARRRTRRKSKAASGSRMTEPRIITFATKGGGSNEEARIRELLRAYSPECFPFDYKHKLRSFRGLM